MSGSDEENLSAEESPAVEQPTEEAESAPAAAAERWAGWPGFCAFRMVVAVTKVGSIIGRKGELIKKMAEETRARIRVLDGPLANPDRIVLITGKEEPELPLSPAMDAAIRVFKRVNGMSESETDGAVTGGAFCSIRLLVASSQGMSLIGKQGSLIKSMQESTGASIRILNHDELPVFATQDERIAELQGESAKVLKALEAVLGHLRKYLVDQTVLPLFEKSYNTPAPVTQERQVDAWAEKSLLHSASPLGIPADYPLSLKDELLFLSRESQLEQRMPASRVPLYDQESALSGLRSSGLGRAGGPFVTQVVQTMQIPLSYAEDIIGIRGSNIAYIRRCSGAALTVEESRGLPDEITVEIKGTSLQVQAAQQLIQEFVNNHKEPVSSSYGHVEADLRSSSYSHMGGSAYSSSSMPTRPYGGGYDSSDLGGYGSGYRY